MSSKLVVGLFAALVLCVPGRAGTREDLVRLDQQTTALSQQVQLLSAQMAQIQQSLQALSARVDAVERSAQTADLRADLETLKRQSEILASQISALQIARESAPAQAPGPFQVPPLRGSDIPPSKAPLMKPLATPPPAAVSPDLYNQAYSDYVQGKYDLASSEFRQFMDAFPSDPRSGNSQYWIGECLYSQKKYAEARDAFRTMVERYPMGNKALAARLKLGLTLVAMEDPAGGIAALKALIQAAPNSDEALIAKDRVAKLQAP